MNGLTYKRHKLGLSDIVPEVHWDIPIWINIDSEFRKNGFDPEKNRGGILFTENWRGHPKFALVIAQDSNLMVGEEFVVSNESVYSFDPDNRV